MKLAERRAALESARVAAGVAGALMKKHLYRLKKVDESTPHDIKLELDVRCQKLITRELAQHFLDIPVLGEEAIDTRVHSTGARWVVDPIDGTVNFAHGIPHAAVSIALQERHDDQYLTTVGLVYDPFMDECWTAIRGYPAYRNGRKIHVSSNTELSTAVISLGFAKSSESLNQMLPVFHKLIPKVRKIRLMGSAALAMTYVADGRFDAYIEHGIRLWDIAAGALIVEQAGGQVHLGTLPEDYSYAMQCSNHELNPSLTHLVY